jgi:hypothetical protein
VSRKTKTFDGDVEDYVKYLTSKKSRREADLMEGWKPKRSAPPRAQRVKRVVVPLPGHRFVYVQRGTTNRIVKENGTVWCTDHNEQLREYPDKRGYVQRKCRSCQTEYQRRYSESLKGQLDLVRRAAKKRGR